MQFWKEGAKLWEHRGIVALQQDLGEGAAQGLGLVGRQGLQGLGMLALQCFRAVGLVVYQAWD